MSQPFQHDSYQHDTLRDDPMPRGAGTSGHAIPHALQRNRQLLIAIGLAVLAALLALAIWQSSGTRDAKHDYANANEQVRAKEREVIEARRTLEQKVAELRVVRAEADVQAARLGNAVEQQVGGEVNDANAVANIGANIGANTAPVAGTQPVYYVRDNQGRFVPVTRP